MNERVTRLRDESVNTRPSINSERAVLLTHFFRDEQLETVSPAIRRARSFQYLMEHKTVYLGRDELIVGERGPAPKVTPTYPEICCHTVEELEILDSREKVAYHVDATTRDNYRDEIIPFWKGKTIREKIFQEMTPDWFDAYQAGVFTEFMEQRAPGHTALDEKIYKKGLIGLKAEIRQALEELDFMNDHHAYSRQQQLNAMDIAANAVIRYAERHSDAAAEMARNESDPDRAAELENIARICRHVPAHPPRNFREALQAYWFVHVAVITELNTWDAISPGRLDQHLIPFYRNDLKKGILTVESARELLQCFWIKFNNQPAPPKVGVTAEESGTYNDFALISLGGLKRDGSDGVNELSFLILDVLEEMELVQPHCCVQLSQKNPDRIVKRAVEVNRTGVGQPSMFNADAVVQDLFRR
ncbi:hypothetical protein BVY01_04700 [bacterium I07]|nr:hypothetical protein BVY01_04700 [bacterium I07]